MRGPRFETRVSGRLLLLLLLLRSGLTRTEDELQEYNTPDVEEEEGEGEAAEEEDADPAEDVAETTPIPAGTEATNTEEEEVEGDHGSGRSFDLGAAEGMIEGFDVTSSPEEEEGLDLLLIVIPVVLVVLISTIIVCCICISRRINRNTTHSEVNKEDPYLDGCSSEKVPMPMFEEDVPSVLELEMADLDDWIKKDGTLSDHNQNA
ncbi:transmembrane protein 154 isoform X3 [Eucyclogobius newberryi]|uniref:transmembrane protein 154 isoform X3 n=1 Tax=Eucyclogobius newberryi TaxID=166745 RepID=UPI003B5AEF31